MQIRPVLDRFFPFIPTEKFAPKVFFCMADQILIIAECDFPMSIFQRHPSNFTDFLLLAPCSIIIGITQKIDHLFADIWPGVIFHTLPESIFQLDRQTSFLMDLPQSGFHFCFAFFNMPFWERPVSAKTMFEQEQLRLAVLGSVHQCATGLLLAQWITPSFRHYIY